MAGNRRKAASVRLLIPVPVELVAELDNHISSRRGKNRSNKTSRISRSSVVVELLESVIDVLKNHDDFGKLLVSDVAREQGELDSRHGRSG
jgi:hypothetical protein